MNGARLDGDIQIFRRLIHAQRKSGHNPGATATAIISGTEHPVYTSIRSSFSSDGSISSETSSFSASMPPSNREPAQNG